MTPSAFTRAAMALGREARARGLEPPAFRSPPRAPRQTRTLRRYPGGAVVSVAIIDRADDDVVRDLAAGLLAANGKPIDGPEADYLAAAALDAALATTTT